jgi:hypothetical protein
MGFAQLTRQNKEIQPAGEYWPGNRIPYEIDPQIMSDTFTIQHINTAIDNWNQTNEVFLVPHTSEADWAIFKFGVSASLVGRKGGSLTEYVGLLTK